MGITVSYENYTESHLQALKIQEVIPNGPAHLEGKLKEEVHFIVAAEFPDEVVPLSKLNTLIKFETIKQFANFIHECQNL